MGMMWWGWESWERQKAPEGSGYRSVSLYFCLWPLFGEKLSFQG